MLRAPQDDDFDLKFAPEFAGQAAEEEVEDEEYEDDAEYDDEEYDDEEYEESDEDDSEDYDEEDDEDEEDEETVPQKQYQELRKFATQKAMELSAIKKQLLESVAVRDPEPQQAKPNENPLRQPMDELISNKVKEQLADMLAPIREQEEALALQTSIFTLAESDEDFSDVAPMFMEQIEANPDILNIKGGIELAYKAAKADYQVLVQAARIKAEAQSIAQRRAMKKTVTDGASYARPSQTKARSEADIIKEQILASGSRKTFG